MSLIHVCEMFNKKNQRSYVCTIYILNIYFRIWKIYCSVQLLMVHCLYVDKFKLWKKPFVKNLWHKIFLVIWMICQCYCTWCYCSLDRTTKFFLFVRPWEAKQWSQYTVLFFNCMTASHVHVHIPFVETPVQYLQYRTKQISIHVQDTIIVYGYGGQLVSELLRRENCINLYQFAVCIVHTAYNC